MGDGTKTYSGSRTMDGIVVRVNGARLDERYDLARFTHGGFEWTYEGDEPRQLALALLADFIGDDRKALDLCEAFMRSVVANLENDWELTDREMAAAVAALGAGD